MLPTQSEAVTIESLPASQICDSDAGTLLSEIRTKSKQPHWFVIAIPVWLVLTVAAYIAGVTAGSVALVLGTLLLPFVYLFDQRNRAVVVMYDLESDSETAFRGLYDSLMQLRNCGAVWSVITEQVTGDYKHTGGASRLLQRQPAVIRDTMVPFLRTNVTVPSLQLHRDTLYFFPDRIFVTNQGGIGVVSYVVFKASASVSRFIEDGIVPRDSTQVDTTWRFVNKNGGPDRRFANNRPVPILAYQEVVFGSETGVRGYLQVSRSDGANAFLEALDKMRTLQPQAVSAAKQQEQVSSGLPNPQAAT